MSDAYERPSDADTAREIADQAFAQGFTAEDFAEVLFGESEGCIEVADGCTVEPDGWCEHGHRSPLLVLGYI